MPSPNPDELPRQTASADLFGPSCVLIFNASDPSGTGGLGADIMAMASVGAHALPVVTGAYARDTAQIFSHFVLDEEAVDEQARAVLEDVEVAIIKVGFVGSAENLGRVAGIASDYPDIPVVAYMPSLSWWEEEAIEQYLEAFKDLLLPQTTVLVGSHSTLWQWLLPDWSTENRPGARDIAKAAHDFGVPYTLVTGMQSADQSIENMLATPYEVLAKEKFARLDAIFSGAGDTLSAALAALLANGGELPQAASEALCYLDRCLGHGFRPGMGHAIPDRLFWAQADPESESESESEQDHGPDHGHGHNMSENPADQSPAAPSHELAPRQ